jgi:hypothetical protein
LAAVIERIEEEGFIYVKYHALRDPWKVTLAKKEKGLASWDATNK